MGRPFARVWGYKFQISPIILALELLGQLHATMLNIVRARVCVRACVRACVRVCVYVCVCVEHKKVESERQTVY